MQKVRVPLTNFAFGEVSPSLYSRTDSAVYNQSAQRVKNFLVGKMNQIKSIGTFLQKGNGFEVTNPEGYVAVDRMGNAVKLVDRLEFSTANFTLAKNWIKG